MRGKAGKNGKVQIIIRKEEVIMGGGHGGAWKVAYADFVTAMMAFFLLMWLLNATTEAQRKGLADYFSPNNVLSHSSSGIGQPFGGRTAFADGAMISDLGAVQVTQGQQPVVDHVDDDDPDVIAQPRPTRDDTKSDAPDLGGKPAGASPDAGAGAAVIVARTAAAVPVSAAAAVPGPVAAAIAGPAAAKVTAPVAVNITAPVAVASASGVDVPRPPTEAELRAELAKRETQAFDQAAQQIRDAVRGDPDLRALANQLAIDLTPEGLRIQILDADRVPMFQLGSAEPNDRARLLLQKVAPALARLTQDISISGHTDAAPYVGSGRSNWELSADRANATRRLLIEGGLQQTRIRSVTGNADRDPLLPTDPLAAANRRIAITVLRSVRPSLGNSSSAVSAPQVPATGVPPPAAPISRQAASAQAPEGH
jgi:chemotaxis protein MotB